MAVPRTREAVFFMGRVLAGAALTALILTAVITVHESVGETRCAAVHVGLVDRKEKLSRIRARLMEQEASYSRLGSLSWRALRIGLSLRVPGLPDCFLEEGARVGPGVESTPLPVRN